MNDLRCTRYIFWLACIKNKRKGVGEESSKIMQLQKEGRKILNPVVPHCSCGIHSSPPEDQKVPI